MTEAELEREAYNEQAWEMRANDIKPPSFKEWKAQKARIAAFLAQRAAEQQSK